MESDAFKIPLRTNPSTLPNVFPTILCAEPGLQDKQKKLVFYPLLKTVCLIWSIRIMSWETDGEDVEGAKWFFSSSLFTDSIKQRVDQRFGLNMDTCSSAVNVRLQSRSASVMTAVTNQSLSSSILTQVRIVWSLINSVSAAGVCGGLWHLDPDSVVTIFFIRLTPSVSKTKMYAKRVRKRESHTLLMKTYEASLKWYFIRCIHLMHSSFLHFCSFTLDLTVKKLFPSSSWQVYDTQEARQRPPAPARRACVSLSLSPISGTINAPYMFTLIHCGDDILPISWSVFLFQRRQGNR